ncbi:MAG: hypothetical protein IPG56_10245 [Caulobacteraceae bacterium]|nr:hypothetical protein [Caulobacteraceae bacterium]
MVKPTWERSKSTPPSASFPQALDLARDAVDDMLEADLLTDFGLVEMERGNFSAARAHFSEARDFAQSFEYVESVAYADYNMAEALIAESRLDEAEAMLRQTGETAERLNENYLELFIDLAIARIAARRGDSERALSIAESVRVRAAAAGVRRAELEALMHIAEAQLLLAAIQMRNARLRLP